MTDFTKGMRERLLGLLRGAQEAGRSEDETQGCAIGAVLATIIAIAIAAIVILGGMYLAGIIDFDFTQTPEERAATAVEEPGPPFMEGRHYAIFATGDTGERRVYTIELIGDGPSGAIRVWEDDTGQGTFEIVDGRLLIEMQRMVPPEQHEILEPNVFEGSLADDGSGFSGTWTRESWMGVKGDVQLTGESESVPFDARRL